MLLFESELNLVWVDSVHAAKRGPILGNTMNGIHPVELYFHYSALFMHMILSDLLESSQDVERSSIPVTRIGNSIEVSLC